VVNLDSGDNAMRLAHGVLVFQVVLLRTWKKSLRRPVALTFSLFQPLMWMLFFGFLMQRYPLGGLPGAVSYTSFLLPGICAMTVLFGASQSGIGIIRDLQNGLLQRMLLTPAPRWAIHLGRVVADSLRLLVQAMVVAGIGLLVGATLQTHWQPLALGVLALFLFALGFASLSNIVALRTGRQETMATFVHLINMPLFFTSTALVPGRQMPDWLASIAAYNPLSLAVDSLRGALLYQRPPDLIGQLLPLLLMALILGLWAILELRRGLALSVWESR